MPGGPLGVVSRGWQTGGPAVAWGGRVPLAVGVSSWSQGWLVLVSRGGVLPTVNAAVIGAAQGQCWVRRSRMRRPPRAMRPAMAKIRGCRRLGSRHIPLFGVGVHRHPAEQVVHQPLLRQPVVRTKRRSPSPSRRVRSSATGQGGLQDRGMVTGMASKKVTITLDEAQLDRIRALVGSGTAPSVSGFIQHAVAVALDDVAGWGALLAEALRETGGALSDDERAWANEVLGVKKRQNRSAA